MLEKFLDHCLENSYRDFHAKGIDYLCLKRDNALTLKVYFFDGDYSGGHEVVNPHDHRYNFDTVVLDGAVANCTYEKKYSDLGGPLTYNEFLYYTPLNGGVGFLHNGYVRLGAVTQTEYSKGDRWHSPASDIHTLLVRKPGTVLFLRQYEDIVSGPTLTYVPASTFPSRKGDAPPKLDGLYSRFTVDQLVNRVKELEARTGKSLNELMEG